MCALLLVLLACRPPVEDSGATDSPVATVHPTGYADPGAHGLEANLQVQDCTTCHGTALDGGSSGVGCDTCHGDGDGAWRTDCTFCHGGVDDGTGAPPVNIDGSTTPLPFADHTAHVGPDRHPAYTCSQCHVEPGDALDVGHAFVDDLTPGAAEVDFTAGFAATATYDAAGTCTAVYCHGDGQPGSTGTARSGETYGCTDCHGGAANAGHGMGGGHGIHLAVEEDCDQCHAQVADGNTAIKDPGFHVDGLVETAFPSDMVYDPVAQTCTGHCHSEEHEGRSWLVGDTGG